MEANIHGLYEKFKAGNLIASHEGVITSDNISKFLEKSENTLAEKGENVKKIRKIYNILVEILQNLYHYQAVPPQGFKADCCKNGDTYTFCTMVKDTNGGYRINSGNFVPNKVALSLKGRLEQLNTLSQEELKELYKVVLNNDEFTEKGGGGLGFIEIARKSGNKFSYDFVKYDTANKFFILEVLVN